MSTDPKRIAALAAAQKQVWAASRALALAKSYLDESGLHSELDFEIHHDDAADVLDKMEDELLAAGLGAWAARLAFGSATPVDELAADLIRAADRPVDAMPPTGAQVAELRLAKGCTECASYPAAKPNDARAFPCDHCGRSIRIVLPGIAGVRNEKK